MNLRFVFLYMFFLKPDDKIKIWFSNYLVVEGFGFQPRGVNDLGNGLNLFWMTRLQPTTMSLQPTQRLSRGFLGGWHSNFSPLTVFMLAYNDKRQC